MDRLKNLIRYFHLMCFLIVLSTSCFSQTPSRGSSQNTSESAKDFVLKYYNWYLPKALANNKGPAWEIALKNRSSNFSSDLLHALREDLDAQNKAEGEIVGLDFDPFLSSQDPCEHYEIGQIKSRPSGYLVAMHGVCSGKKSAKPDIVAEITRKNDQWLFVNFRYPDDGDLLSILKSLKESRKK